MMAFDKVKVSVLVPVYNVRDFLSKCLESILVQSFCDFELILVDDGSTDESGSICEQYAAKDSRVRIFHQVNQGISKTREFALQQARGEYIMWVDSDDWIEPDMLQQMVESAEANQSDIIGCNLDVVWKDSIWKIETKHTDIEAYRRDMIASQWTVLWRHLFRRSLIEDNEIHFPDGINNGEDYYFVCNCFLYAKKFSFVDKILYHYNRWNEGSTMALVCENKIYEQIEATRFVEHLLIKLNQKKLYKKELQFRKHIAKEKLFQISFWKWMFVFPDASMILLKAIVGKQIHSSFF